MHKMSNPIFWENKEQNNINLLGDNLHALLNPIFWKKRKYFNDRLLK